jgi:hypothetical protein
MRIVGSMSTLPDRLDNITKPIKHILRQTHSLDVLYLNIPWKTLKGRTYDIPEDFIDNFTGYRTKVILNRCSKDYGPITKLAPTLDLEKDPDTYILTFDDDIIPRRHLIKTLCQKIQQYPDTCLGFSGVCIGSFPFYFQFAIDNRVDQNVDWIQGVHVVAYKRSFFTNIKDLVSFGNDTPLKDVLVFNDDHRVSAYLASKNIPRISIGCEIKNFLFKYGDGQEDALSSRHVELVKEHFKIINYFKNNGIYYHSYTFTRSLLFFIILGLSISLTIFMNTKNLHNSLRIILIIISILILKHKLRNSLVLKNYSLLAGI